VASDLGEEVIIATTTELRLDPTRITSDIDDFRKSLSSQDWSRAAQLYTGAFLDGF
jgi:hypothetical protein